MSTAAARPDDKATDIPELLEDKKNNKTYQRLRFFGKVCENALGVDAIPDPKDSYDHRNCRLR